MSGLCMPLRFLLLLFCVFASSFFMINALVFGLSACRPSQIQALMEFKSEFDSSNCNQRDYVNGVECNNATGAVEILILPSGCLIGTLKPNSSLFNLHHLRYLDLADNDFTFSSLPSGFGSFNKLEVLSLYSNGFIGQVPSSFSNLSQLSFLDLFHNKLTGSFPLVRNLTKLYHLDLSDNHLSGALNPNSSLFELHHLRYLDLDSNNYGSSIPYEFGNLNRLEVLSLSGFIGQVPCSFSNLSRLTKLHLDYNKFTGSFPHIQNLTNLSLLTLYDSQLEGKILEPISKLINLKILGLSHLNTSYPVDLSVFSSLKSLAHLYLYDMETSISSDSNIPLNLEALYLLRCGLIEFPNILKNLQKLKYINFSNNKIKGKIPEWFWNLPNLYSVSLFNNSFTDLEGSEEVLVNSPVRILDLALNHFKGPFPTPPLSINVLSIWHNSFTGNIPLATCNRSSLAILDLSNNNFTGPIPQCLSNFHDSLTVVNFRKNNLEGSLPDMFHDVASLRTLDVGYNKLSGKLPRSLLNCSSLRFVSLDNNKIKDTFPFWLKALPDLQALTLRSNKFYGPIFPPHQGPLAFPKLRILDISDNKFTGSLPPNYFVNWEASSLKMDEDGKIYMGYYGIPIFKYDDTIDLQYKGLFMEQEKILTSYSTIDFSGNRLEGQIPESIGLLKALIALNLSDNAFTGHIPLSLANLTELESLDLSKNQLSGTIPNGLGSLSFLAYINVSHNQLKGEIPQGPQITGQSKSSFEGNAGLCGLPLEETCFGSKVPPTQQPEEEEEGDEEKEQVFNWKAVAIGYGSGVLFGLAVAHVIASYKPEWIVKIVGLNKRRNS